MTLRLKRDFIFTVNLGVSSRTHRVITYEREFVEGTLLEGRFINEDDDFVDFEIDGTAYIPIYEGRRALLEHLPKSYFEVVT